MNQIATTGNSVPALTQGETILSVIERVAMNPEADIEKMKALMEMKKDFDREENRKAYAVAFVKMQPEIPIIKHNRSGDNNKWTYADFAAIDREIGDTLKAGGFGYYFTQDDGEKDITITCHLVHSSGHTEHGSIKLPYDTTGSKNATQARNSTVSYGKRITLCSLLGITTEKDDDGKKGGDAVEKVTDVQAQAIHELLMKCSTETIDEFKKFYGVIEGTTMAETANVPKAEFDGVIARLKKESARVA